MGSCHRGDALPLAAAAGSVPATGMGARCVTGSGSASRLRARSRKYKRPSWSNAMATRRRPQGYAEMPVRNGTGFPNPDNWPFNVYLPKENVSTETGTLYVLLAPAAIVPMAGGATKPVGAFP